MYYQSLYGFLTEVLAMPEETEEEIDEKAEQLYVWVSGIAAMNYGTNDPLLPYFIQAYQELGNTGYDFSYLRKALGDKNLLTITEEQERDVLWLSMFNNGEIQIERKELMGPKIENMLKTTDDYFILIYGSSDPFYPVRPADVTGRDNIMIYVDDANAHQSVIQYLPEQMQEEVMNKIKTILDIKE